MKIILSLVKGTEQVTGRYTGWCQQSHLQNNPFLVSRCQYQKQSVESCIYETSELIEIKQSTSSLIESLFTLSAKVWSWQTYFNESWPDGHMVALRQAHGETSTGSTRPESDTQGHKQLFITSDKERACSGCGASVISTYTTIYCLLLYGIKTASLNFQKCQFLQFLAIYCLFFCNLKSNSSCIIHVFM